MHVRMHGMCVNARPGEVVVVVVHATVRQCSVEGVCIVHPSL